MKINQPKRILQIFGILNQGGAETRTMELYRELDRSKVQFDFLVHSTETGYYEREAVALGANIYHVPKFIGYNIKEYREAFIHILKKNNNWNAVHIHMTSTATLYIGLFRAKGIKVICHARSAGVTKGVKGFATRVLTFGLARKSDVLIACSTEAAISTFGRRNLSHVEIIPNAIPLKKYVYDNLKRFQIRNRYGISEQDIVVGHVGAFRPEKNHEFLIEVFAAYHSIHKNSKLLLVGTGNLMHDVEIKINKMKLKDNVILAGGQQDVAAFYSAMDYFLLPSFYEGFPGVAVEAQRNGLPCLLSDTITREVSLTDNIAFESISKGVTEWVNWLQTKEPGLNRFLSDELFQKVDVVHAARKYEIFYLGL